jgi:Methylamine utilisation protein MauE
MPAAVWAAFLSALMLFSGWSKLADMQAFQTVLREYRVASRNAQRSLARSILTFELLTGVILLLPLRWATFVGMLLVLCFLCAVSVATGVRMARGEKTFRCGCSGDLSRAQSARALLARNIGLGVLTLLALRYAPSAPTGLPNVLSGVGLFALIQLVIASLRAREAALEWKALG